MGEVGLPLLKTKFYIPPQRPNLVHRQRLMAKLEEASQHQFGLILVSAKAGSGKTTLVSDGYYQAENEHFVFAAGPHTSECVQLDAFQCERYQELLEILAGFLAW